jgi:CDGSH-type Zn-finger protein
MKNTLNLNRFFFSDKFENNLDENNDIQTNTGNLINTGEIVNTNMPEENNENVKIHTFYNIESKKMEFPNVLKHIDNSKINNKNVTLQLFNREIFNLEYEEKFIPVSPKLGPFEILNPKLESKTYHWCACGMSKKQPFCDMSHKNSKIRPISFKLGEKCDSMLLCGCKLSTKAPFCDGFTCVNLKEKDEKELIKKIQRMNKN